MALLKTFAEVKASRVLQVASSCPDSDEFRSLVNEGTDLALQCGDWPGTVVPARFLVNNGCIVWPRWVGRIRRINQCRVPLKVNTIWHEFVDRDQYLPWCGLNYFSDGCGGTACGPVGIHSFGRYGAQGGLNSEGNVPTFNDIPSDTPRYVRVYPQSSSDIGKTVTIFGIDANGQTLMSTDANNITTPGVVITLAAPFASTSVTVQRIDAVLKDVTQKPVTMYSYEPISNTMLQLAIYAPDETNPGYAKDRLFAAGRRECKCPMTVIALIKMAFVPVVLDTDYVQIPSLSALKKIIQSIKYGESGDIQNQSLFFQSAVNDLNKVMDNEIPIYETPVDEGFGGEKFGLGMQQVI